MPMKYGRILVCTLACAALLSACSSEHDRPKRAETRRPGEFTEYELLGISPYRQVSELDIRRALAQPHSFALREGGSVLLIESGADSPDATLVRILGQHFDVHTLCGLPSSDEDAPDPLDGDDSYSGDSSSRHRRGGDESAPPPSGGGDGDERGGGGMGGGPGGGMGGGPGMGGPGMGGHGGRHGGSEAGPLDQNGRGHNFMRPARIDKALRLAAARAGCETLVVVWTRSPDKGVPPLRAAVVDVATGRWELLSPLVAQDGSAKTKGKWAEGGTIPDTEKEKDFQALSDALVHAEQ